MSIAFLFGAGVSIPAKMPSTKVLTKEILCDYDKWCVSFEPGKKYQTVESYKKYHSGLEPDPKHMSEIGNFIHKIRSLLVRHFENESDITYEDLYDAMNQIHGHLCENYKNPLIEIFLKDLKERCNSFIDSPSVEGMNFIEDVVKLRLQSKGHKPELKPLINFVTNHCEGDVHIFTLNFDTLIEKQLKNGNISFEDGFTLPLYNNQVNLWQMESLLSSKIKGVKLYKLHGSLDWEHLWGGEYHYQFVKIINRMENYPYFECNGDVRVYGQYDELLGVANKLLSYNYGIFLDMLCLFNLKLKECQTLVISGYSFSDYGINLRIVDWMARTKDSKIIFIDPYSESTLQKSRGSIHSQFDNWIREGKMKVINDGFQNWDGLI